MEISWGVAGVWTHPYDDTPKGKSKIEGEGEKNLRMLMNGEGEGAVADGGFSPGPFSLSGR